MNSVADHTQQDSSALVGRHRVTAGGTFEIEDRPSWCRLAQIPAPVTKIRGCRRRLGRC
jgi:hypothetical protein